ncbi:MltA-interacting MipA family protein [Vibrio coralliilyticus]|nr:MipA/OmpV family protein [Vibrio coralliilyticus]KPH25401.1 MltA-interacting MipA family protein [Vibrio coralliilyticus]
MININRQLALTMLAASAISFSAAAEEETSISEQDWGIAAVYRMASIPFYTGNNDQTVGTFVPMMYFENEHVFVEGLQGGAYLYKPEDEAFQLSALMRLRFVDIPSSEQNSNGGDAVDFGGQLRYFLDEDWYLDAELMTDDEFRFHSNLSISGEFEYGDWELKPHARLRYKDADFNSQYYTFSDVTKENVGGGVDLNVGIDARYHVYSNLYLLGSTSVTRLDNNAYHSSTVEDRYQGEFYIGFGFFNDKSKAPKSELKNKRYFRIAHGWATPSNIGDIMKLNTEKDPYNNQMTSFFYGHPLTDELFGVPLDIYFTPGIVHHWSSDVQSASTEYVAAIKAYYTFNWPTQWRFGVAEGMSFIDSITYIEQTEMDSKGYNASNLLNYLDFSFDINVGDLINNRDLDNMWVGYSLHHRSAIFEQASQYGRIKGGSNYNTIYVQFDF